jgi:hypothetical protein
MRRTPHTVVRTRHRDARDAREEFLERVAARGEIVSRAAREAERTGDPAKITRAYRAAIRFLAETVEGARAAEVRIPVYVIVLALAGVTGVAGFKARHAISTLVATGRWITRLLALAVSNPLTRLALRTLWGTVRVTARAVAADPVVAALVAAFFFK